MFTFGLSKFRSEEEYDSSDYGDEFELEEGEFNNIDKNEMKEIYQFKLKMYENEEKRLREEMSQLDKEKVQFIQEFKRIRDEEASKYCGINSKGSFTVL